MKKGQIILLFILTLSPLQAQSIPALKVALLPIENRTDNDVYEVFCEETARIMEFNLLLLNDYQIENLSADVIQAEEFNLQQYMTEQSFDRSLEGTLEQRDSRLYFTLNLYNREETDPVFSRSAEIKRFMDIFNITDVLIVEMLEFLTGRHIAYGSINLNNNGEEGAFELELDGIPVQMKDGILPDILVGTYDVAIVQNRFGQRYTVHKETITVEEGGFLDIEYSLPYLTDQEQAIINDFRTILKERALGESSLETSRQAEQELRKLFSDLMFCPALKVETITNRKIIASAELINIQKDWYQHLSSKKALSAETLLALQRELQFLEMEEEKRENLNNLFQTYAQLKTLEAAGLLWLTEAEQSLAIYDDLMAYNIYYSEEFRSGLFEEYALVRKVCEEKGVLRLKRRNVALPVILYSLAAVSLGGALTIDIGDFIGQNEQTIQSNLVEYEAISVTPDQNDLDQMAALHKEAELLRETNETLDILRVSGYIGGAACGTAGVVTSFFVKKKLDLKQDKAFKRIYKKRWKTAGEWALKKRFSFTVKDYNNLFPAAE